MTKLILLSGPSCVGKSPLLKALKRFYPDILAQYEKLVLFNDRAMRPGEQDGVDYHFRSHDEIKSMKDDNDYLVIPVRQDTQALRIADVTETVEAGKSVFYEGAPYVVNAIRDCASLEHVERTSVFLSPLNREEVLYFKETLGLDGLKALVTDIMRKKQLRRKQHQMGIVSAPDLEDIEIRCQAAFDELKEAPAYDFVIPNHDGEDSENWGRFGYPIGDARQTMLALAAVLGGEEHPVCEAWYKEDFV